MKDVKLLNEWHPGVEIDHLTVREVLATLPGDEPTDIPWQVRMLENPASPFCLPGGSTLERHDPLHPILAHGTSKLGEMFVLGFSMGAAQATRGWHLVLWRFWVRYINPAQFRMGAAEIESFNRGVALAQGVGAKDIHLIPLEDRMDETVGSLRKLLGITTDRLRQEPYAHQGE